MKTTKTKTVAPAAALPTLTFASPRAFSAWLADNHAASRGIWLALARKASGTESITYAEAVEVALAWGWIDGQKQRGDASSWLQKFTPRGAKSVWSKVNREKVRAFIEAGAMQPAGLAEVERAKRDGRWDAAYDPPSRATVPDDLQAALATNEQAAAFFLTLNARSRYAVLWRVQTAKKVETRQRRIAEFVAMFARGEQPHP
ncbi:MAG: YdeI/OmpD-associated family protein [Polyangiales bacterium]